MATISFAGEDEGPTPCPGWLRQDDCGDKGRKGRIPGVWRHDLCQACAKKFCAAIDHWRTQQRRKIAATISGPETTHGLGF